MNGQIEVTLTFSGDREVRLTAKDAEYKDLILLMFKHRQSWKTVEVNEEGGFVRLMPDMPKGVE
jgi:hypothetical protein